LIPPPTFFVGRKNVIDGLFGTLRAVHSELQAGEG
jgi:hypothetical protein